MGIGDWGLGIGDWGLGIGDWAQSPIPNTTTMDKRTRTLLRVRIDDPIVVEKRISVLMGRDASLRRSWIEENVKFDVVDNFIKEVVGNGH